MPYRAVKMILAVALIVLILVTFGVWTLPVEFARAWAAKRAGDDFYAQFEAIGQAEILWWLFRVLAPFLVILTIWGIIRCEEVVTALLRVADEFLAATRILEQKNKLVKTLRTGALRGLIAAWLLIGGAHLAAGISTRAREWVYYRFNSGDVVLPNISDSNRDVIRYLKEATPADARILVCSDQKLFFLSYYLLPRKLYHFIHPDSEFVIPLAHQSRQLTAYRLSDLTPEQIEKWKPDYLLEYFEGADFLEQSRRGEDRNWVQFWQMRNRSSELPPYVVVLRRTAEGGQP